MDCRPVIDRTLWDGFVAKQPLAQFVQSWGWGEFQSALGRDVLRLGLFDGANLVAVAQVITMPLPLGRRYCYVPRGPIMLEPNKPAVACALIRGILEQTGHHGLPLALRIEPPYEVDGRELICLDYGFRHAPDMQPAISRYLDLTKSIEQLKAEQHQKTRYNIGLAERKGVTVQQRTDVDGMRAFLKLQHETAARDKIKPFSDVYFVEMFKALVPTDALRVYTAEFEGKTLAADIVIRYGDTITYSHGASSDEDRNLMAPHLLQWKQVEEAKNDGFHYYDFRGIAPTDDPEHPWAGITRFKAGFGGRVVRFVGTYDLPLRTAWYWTYRGTQRVVSLIRR